MRREKRQTKYTETSRFCMDVRLLEKDVQYLASVFNCLLHCVTLLCCSIKVHWLFFQQACHKTACLGLCLHPHSQNGFTQ